MKRMNQGFTLIELMIVVAIIGILAAVAVPQYQNYTIRARMTDALSILSGAKTAYTEFVSSEGGTPDTLASIGVAVTVNSNVVNDLTLGASDTVIIAEITNLGGNITGNETIGLAATVGTFGITWTCRSSSIENEYLPSNCR